MEELEILDKVLYNKSGGCDIMVYSDMSEYEVVVQGAGKVYVSLLKDVVSSMYKILVDEYDKYLKDSVYL
ncbi:hypothetical protein VL10_ORF04 [Staphylococcus phage vB_SauM_VL10]|nr:hypothetical protein VL10_ORF04 [Staphylococcus phage vB_SauM_VL10]